MNYLWLIVCISITLTIADTSSIIQLASDKLSVKSPLELIQNQIDYHLIVKNGTEFSTRVTNGNTDEAVDEFLNGINESLPVYFIIHGWTAKMDILPAFTKIWNQIVDEDIGNAIRVNWNHTSGQLYSFVNMRLPKIAMEISNFITFLGERKGFTPANVTIIGHSLGAHLAGFIGKRLKNLNRIDALDPAGPYFRSYPNSLRLNAHDADFVTVIHTDVIYGIKTPLGHADFYPNGGSKQPNCNMMSDVRGCSHNLAVDYYYESLTRNIPSARCMNYKMFQIGICELSDAYMGHRATPNLRGSFYNNFQLESDYD